MHTLSDDKQHYNSPTCLPSAPSPGGPGGPGGPGSPVLPRTDPSGILKPAGPLPTSAGWHRPQSPCTGGGMNEGAADLLVEIGTVATTS